MIAVDTNILVYAHRQDSPWHAPAAACLVSLAEGPAPWAIPWPCIHEFLGVVTHPRVFRTPTPVEKALSDVELLFQSPSLQLIGEQQSYWPHFRDVMRRTTVVGPMVHDARIAALCRAHGVSELLSADRDFSRFTGLKIRNPLV